MKLDFETTPEQDAAILARHAIDAPDTPIDQYVHAGIAAKLQEIVDWYTAQKSRVLLAAYKDATADERAAVDTTLALVEKLPMPVVKVNG